MEQDPQCTWVTTELLTAPCTTCPNRLDGGKTGCSDVCLLEERAPRITGKWGSKGLHLVVEAHQVLGDGLLAREVLGGGKLWCIYDGEMFMVSVVLQKELTEK